MLLDEMMADVVFDTCATMACTRHDENDSAAVRDTTPPYSRSCKRAVEVYTHGEDDGVSRRDKADDGGTDTAHTNDVLLTLLVDTASATTTTTTTTTTVVRAAPYANAVCGHHLLLAVGDTIWKSYMSAREVCFYDVLTRAAHMHYIGNYDGDDEDARAWRVYAPVASQLLPFLPRYYGTRRVCAMRAVTAATRSLAQTSDTQRSVLQHFAHDLSIVQQQQQQQREVQRTRGGDADAADAYMCDGSCGDHKGSAHDTLAATDAVAVPWCAHTSPLARAVVQREWAVYNKDSHDASPASVDMIVMEDVCYGFVRPCVLDIKMGSRQYGLHPSPAKKHSKEAKALRSTSAKYGIRLAGFRRWDDAAACYERRSKAELHSLTIDAVRETVHYFLSAAASDQSSSSSASLSSCGNALRRKLCAQLQQLCGVFDTQECFAIFTSSLLFVYDAADALRTGRVVMVDFAYAYDKAELHAAHDEAAATRHDEGYRHALRSLIALLE